MLQHARLAAVLKHRYPTCACSSHKSQTHYVAGAAIVEVLKQPTTLETASHQTSNSTQMHACTLNVRHQQLPAGLAHKEATKKQHCSTTWPQVMPTTFHAQNKLTMLPYCSCACWSLLQPRWVVLRRGIAGCSQTIRVTLEQSTAANALQYVFARQTTVATKADTLAIHVLAHAQP